MRFLTSIFVYLSFQCGVIAQFDTSKLMLEFFLDKSYLQRFQVNQCRFYISQINVWKNGQIIHKDDRPGVLVDLNSNNRYSQLIFLENIEADSISVLYGLDSLQQISGAFEGDLDPIHGMYWTWNTGYIHYKLECTERDSARLYPQIKLHLGGFAYPYNTSFQKTYPINMNRIRLCVDPSPMLSKVSQWNKERVMSPGKQAGVLSWLFVHHIKSIP